MPWTDLDPTTATFTTTNMLIPYKGAWSKQFGQKIVKNTGYNYQRGLEAVSFQPVLINGPAIPSGNEQTYNTGDDFVDVNVLLMQFDDVTGAPDNGYWREYWDGSNVSIFPNTPGLNMDTCFVKITTTYKTFASGANEIKAESGGGFTLKNNGVGAWTPVILMIPLRNATYS